MNTLSILSKGELIKVNGGQAMKDFSYGDFTYIGRGAVGVPTWSSVFKSIYYYFKQK